MARHLVKLDHHAHVIADEPVERGTCREITRVVGRTAVAAFDCAVDRWLDNPQLQLDDALRQALAVLHE